MPTSDELRERALALARAGVPTDDAVTELLARCGDHRVPLVRARQALADQATTAPQGARWSPGPWRCWRRRFGAAPGRDQAEAAFAA